MGRADSIHWEEMKDFGGKSIGKLLLGILKHRLDDENKMDITETQWGGMDWIHLALHRDM
jgi:hypothetical protein